MRTHIKNSCIATLIMASMTVCISCTSSKSELQNRTISFDQNWHFLKGDPSGAESPSFDDSGWRLLDLPHDWSIEDLPGQDGESVIGPFSKASIGKMGTGYTVGGTAWYRKEFTIDPSGDGKTCYLRFDGVYMNSDLSSFQQPGCKTWQGRCLAIIRPAGNQVGKITLSAHAEGLSGAEVDITTL